MVRVKVTIGCYIDGAIPRIEAEVITILKNLLRDWNPSHPILKEVYSEETLINYGSEVIDSLTNAINESIDESQCAIWSEGDLLITDCEE